MSLTDKQIDELRADPKAFLMKGRHVYSKIEAKQDRINQWRQIAESVTATLKISGGSSGNAVSSKVENCVTSILDLQNELKIDIRILTDTAKAVSQAIELVPEKNNMRLLLELRYLNYYSWERIAEAIDCSVRWVLTLHGRCLDFLKKL